ncbi:hypothetical protein KK120_20485 [Virgibacillus dakarensis]|uniref:hypothetical protein n=1 Tax=Virgibacillus dakarensis TaxID=1917889 RepID=UPI000B445ECA|nr:hypothetical protein [Virgibacillus dakarensis]MBT2218183.1 hypothetical protein [Virgibacillus dakarensis]
MIQPITTIAPITINIVRIMFSILSLVYMNEYPKDGRKNTCIIMYQARRVDVSPGWVDVSPGWVDVSPGWVVAQPHQ